ncbi:type II toxin-antitoxin system RelE/ParE family toxin [Roseivirga pacifica]|jgi:plasmid stabilization system protein ParE|uniref:type II toxin-antitoxin system RelE/ParE family toxin n=1 Tax=Roseivirga pacifica TaxID=1267423 RepID=UPI00227B15A4|nr:type II toxin-antitoxin system RelE/ParE family toxin [Roseivirga pacifica]
MTKKILWTPTAKDSLKATVSFIRLVWNDQVVEEFLDQLDIRITQVQDNPEIAPAFENSKFRRLLIHKTTSLFYTSHPEHIKLLLVWDNRQNPTALIKALKQT